jgi:hypothetical protein
LTDPWLRHTIYSKSPTVCYPFDLFADENYLEVVPDQLWLVNIRTGKVFQKWPEAAILLLTVTIASGRQAYRVLIDDCPPRMGMIESGTVTFRAVKRLVLVLAHPKTLTDIIMTLNGKSYTPLWSKNEFSATAIVEGAGP